MIHRELKKGTIPVERAGEQRRRYYRLTAAGKRQLASERRSWRSFADAIGRIVEVDYA